MKITIGHLFYDIMNLYGESGNVLALVSALSSQGIETEVKELSITDNIDLAQLDFIYIGMGTDKNFEIVFEYLKQHKQEYIDAININKFFLVTGNSIQLFGKDNLGIFDYSTQKNKDRLVSESTFVFKNLSSTLVGFQNQNGITIDSKQPLFILSQGYGFEKDNVKYDGFQTNNFYGTYMLGPLLARNPEFLEYICKELINSKIDNFEFKPFDLEIERIAKKKFLE